MKKWLITVFVVICPLISSATEDDDAVRKLLDAGEDSYKRGKFEDALAKFEEAIQKKPGSELIRAWIDRTGQALIMQMMNSNTSDEGLNQRLKDVARRLNELSKPTATWYKASRKEIMFYLENLASGETDVWMTSRSYLTHFGPYAVQYLIPLLGDTSGDKLRTRVVLTLTDIGEIGTLALCQALKSRNVFMRQNAALVLGNIKDRRAVGYLKRLLESPDEKPEVKSVAVESLVRIMGGDAGRLEKISAADELYDYAQGYFFGDPQVMLYWEKYYVVWHWDTESDSIETREVPGFAYNEQVAEEVLFDLLHWYPEYSKAYPLFILTHLSQSIEAKEVLEQGQMSKDVEYLPEGIYNDLKKKLEGAENARILAAVPDRRYLYEALDIAVSSKNQQLSVACMDLLKSTASPDDLPASSNEVSTKIGTPLVRALQSESALIRYHAAVTLSKLASHKNIMYGELVIKNLNDAIHETGVRTVLVIYEAQTNEDYDKINRLRAELSKANTVPVIAGSLEDGLMKAKDHSIDDVIMIQYKMAARAYISDVPDNDGTKTYSIFDSLRDDVRTKFVPKVILYDTPEDRDGVKAYKTHIKGSLHVGADRFQIMSLLEEIFTDPKLIEDQKRKADIVAESAANALAAIDVESTVFDYREAIKGISEVLDSDVVRPNSVRTPLVVALGNFVGADTPGSVDSAVRILLRLIGEKPSLDDKKAIKYQEKMRIQAANSLGRIAKKTGLVLQDSQIDELAKHLSDEAYDVREAVAKALSNCRTISNTKIVSILQENRLKRKTLAEVE